MAIWKQTQGWTKSNINKRGTTPDILGALPSCYFSRCWSTSISDRRRERVHDLGIPTVKLLRLPSQGHGKRSRPIPPEFLVRCTPSPSRSSLVQLLAIFLYILLFSPVFFFLRLNSTFHDTKFICRCSVWRVESKNTNFITNGSLVWASRKPKSGAINIQRFKKQRIYSRKFIYYREFQGKFKKSMLVIVMFLRILICKVH